MLPSHMEAKEEARESLDHLSSLAAMKQDPELLLLACVKLSLWPEWVQRDKPDTITLIPSFPAIRSSFNDWQDLLGFL